MYIIVYMYITGVYGAYKITKAGSSSSTAVPKPWDFPQQPRLDAGCKNGYPLVNVDKNYITMERSTIF